MSDHLIRSLMELQEKLHLTMGRKRSKVAIGVHDLDHVTPPFTYKAVEPSSTSFIPLAKDKKMDLNQILKEHEKGRDYCHLLDGKERYPVIFDSKGEVLSFPPIINGRLTTVTEDTRNVFIDVTGTDMTAISGALNIVSTAMAERGGSIESVDVEADTILTTPDLTPLENTLDIGETNALLGLKLDPSQMAACLEKMGHDARPYGSSIKVRSPATRMDILHPVDLMEDVAKGYGYEKFGNTLPTAQTFGSERKEERAADILRQLMIGYGYMEATTLILTSENEQFVKMRLPAEEVVEVLNPISEDHTCLRVRVLPSLMAVLRKSKHRDLPQRLFEVGDVVIGTKRRKHIAVVSISPRASFTEMKSLVEGMMRDLSVKMTIEPSDLGMFIDGRGAKIISEGREIGQFGELHPGLITDFELGYPIAAIELDVESITTGKLERLT